MSTTPETGAEPWVLDPEGVRMLGDLRPGPEGSNPGAFVLDRGVAWFVGTLTSGRSHLFRYDGRRLTVGALVPEGVGEVQILPPPSPGLPPYFALHDPLDPGDLDRRPRAELARVGSGGLERLGLFGRFDRFDHDTNAPFQGGLWLRGVDDDGRAVLWFFDGRALSVVHRPEDAGARIDAVHVAGPRLLFTELSAEGARRLFASDGRRMWEVGGFGAAGTLRNPSLAVALGEEVYVVAERTDTGAELFTLRGDRLVLAADVRPGPEGSGPRFVRAYRGALWFSADAAGRGRELWSWDGRTVLEADICPGECSSRPAGLAVVGGALWFAATDAAHGYRLWRVGPVESAAPPSPSPLPDPPKELRRVHRAVDVFAPSGIDPVVVEAGGALHFTSFAASEHPGGWDLQPWRVDSFGPELVHTRPVASDAVGAAGFAAVDAPWLIRNTAAGGVEFVAAEGGDVVPAPGLLAAPRHTVSYQGAAMFLADTAEGRFLHRFDGTLSRLAPAAGSLEAPPGSVVGGVLYFGGRDELGVELHAWDGENARRVIDLAPGPGDGLGPLGPSSVVGWRDDLWFVGMPPGEGSELVRLSRDGAVAVTAVRSGDASGVSGPPVVLHDVLWFPGSTPETGAEPFVLMSPDAVPRVLVDLAPGTRGSAPADLTTHDGGVYFSASVPGVGRELFRVKNGDGEVELVRDLLPGPGSSDPRSLVPLDSELWFLATTLEGVAIHRFGSDRVGSAAP